MAMPSRTFDTSSRASSNVARAASATALALAAFDALPNESLQPVYLGPSMVSTWLWRRCKSLGLKLCNAKERPCNLAPRSSMLAFMRSLNAVPALLRRPGAAARGT
eukprot:4228114-Alexandrium_andersonii.AAC.1